MNLMLKKIIYLLVFIFVGLTIITLLYKGRYLSAGIIIVAVWAILYMAGAYGVPFYVKRLIVKYLDDNSGKAELTEIVKYCASKNRYFLEFAVKKWLRELEAKNKITIQNGIIIMMN